MKKYKYYLIIICIIMTIPILYRLTITHHEKSYQVKDYQVKEIFNIKNKIHYYDFVIKKNKQTYSFEIENKIHKREKIIKDIKTYKNKNIVCIEPIYINEVERDIYCLKDNLQVSKEILMNEEAYQKILKKNSLTKLQLTKDDETIKEYKNMTIYPHNIPEGYKVIIWNYRGINIVEENNYKTQEFLKEDLYDNIMATTTSRFFVLFENTSVNGIQKIHLYDLIKNKYKIWTLKKEEIISKNSYINGVEDDLIYVTDKENKKQYAFNVDKQEVIEVGNEEDEFILYQNHEQSFVRITDFLAKEQYFDNVTIKNNEITKSKELLKEQDIYYFHEDNNFYMQKENANRILLFTMEDIDKWLLKGNDIVLKKEEVLYFYNNQVGLRKLLEYNELNYNKNQIYFIWK